MAAFILNQPQPRARAAAEKLRGLGHEVVELAFHQLEPVTDELDKLAQLDLSLFDRIVFVSPSSVAFSGGALTGRLPRNSVAAIGQGTATVLLETNLVEDDAQIIRPRLPPFDSAALAQLPPMHPSQIRAMLVVCGEQGRTDWIENYRAQGVRIALAPIYRSHDLVPGPDATDALARRAARKAATILVVGSVSELTAMAQWLTTLPADSAAWMKSLTVVVPHARIARQLNKMGWPDARPTVAGQTLLAAALELA